MVNRSISAAHTFLKCQGIWTTNCFLLPSKNHISVFQLGLRFMLLASIVSKSSSNRDHHPSISEKVTNLDDALILFDEMTLRRPLPSIVKFNQLLDAVTKMKEYSWSVRLFKQMCALGLGVTEYTMAIVIKCCCRLHRTNDGFAILGCCFKRGVIPNVYTFTALLDGLILEDRILEAESLFKKLVEQNLCEPNVVTYSTMIKGLCKIGNNVTSIALLRLMEERRCKPDVFTYSTIIDSLCKEKLIDDAFKLFKEMVFDKGIRPDVVTYNSLVCGLCKLGHWDEVYKLLKDMDDERIYPDLHTFTILVDALCKEGKIEEAEGFMNIMLDKGEVSDVVRCTSLMKGLQPDVRTYTVMISGFCREGRLRDAKELFLAMKESGCLPDNVTYRVLLQGYIKYKECGGLEILLQEMDGSHYSLDAATSSLLLELITTRSLKPTLLKLIGKLVQKS